MLNYYRMIFKVLLVLIVFYFPTDFAFSAYCKSFFEARVSHFLKTQDSSLLEGLFTYPVEPQNTPIHKSWKRFRAELFENNGLEHLQRLDPAKTKSPLLGKLALATLQEMSASLKKIISTEIFIYNDNYFLSRTYIENQNSLNHNEYDDHIVFSFKSTNGERAHFLLQSIELQNQELKQFVTLWMGLITTIQAYLNKNKSITYIQFIALQNLAVKMFSGYLNPFDDGIYFNSNSFDDNLFLIRNSLLENDPGTYLDHFPNFLRLPLFTSLDHYSFLELGSDLMPEWVTEVYSLSYDAEISQSPRDPFKHDKEHNSTLEYAFANSSDKLLLKIKILTRFFRSYAQIITPEERLVLGSVLFTVLHEDNNLKLYSKIFSKSLPKGELLASVSDAYSRFKTENDYELSSNIAHQISQKEFESLFWYYLEKAKTNFQEFLEKENISFIFK